MQVRPPSSTNRHRTSESVLLGALLRQQDDGESLVRINEVGSTKAATVYEYDLRGLERCKGSPVCVVGLRAPSDHTLALALKQFYDSADLSPEVAQCVRRVDALFDLYGNPPRVLTYTRRNRGPCEHLAYTVCSVDPNCLWASPLMRCFIDADDLWEVTSSARAFESCVRRFDDASVPACVCSAFDGDGDRPAQIRSFASLALCVFTMQAIVEAEALSPPRQRKVFVPQSVSKRIYETLGVSVHDLSTADCTNVAQALSRASLLDLVQRFNVLISRPANMTDHVDSRQSSTLAVLPPPSTSHAHHFVAAAAAWLSARVRPAGPPSPDTPQDLLVSPAVLRILRVPPESTRKTGFLTSIVAGAWPRLNQHKMSSSAERAYKEASDFTDMTLCTDRRLVAVFSRSEAELQHTVQSQRLGIPLSTPIYPARALFKAAFNPGSGKYVDVFADLTFFDVANALEQSEAANGATRDDILRSLLAERQTGAAAAHAQQPASRSPLPASRRSGGGGGGGGGGGERWAESSASVFDHADPRSPATPQRAVGGQGGNPITGTFHGEQGAGAVSPAYSGDGGGGGGGRLSASWVTMDGMDTPQKGRWGGGGGGGEDASSEVGTPVTLTPSRQARRSAASHLLASGSFTSTGSNPIDETGIFTPPSKRHAASGGARSTPRSYASVTTNTPPHHQGGRTAPANTPADPRDGANPGAAAPFRNPTKALRFGSDGGAGGGSAAVGQHGGGGAPAPPQSGGGPRAVWEPRAPEAAKDGTPHASNTGYFLSLDGAAPPGEGGDRGRGRGRGGDDHGAHPTYGEGFIDDGYPAGWGGGDAGGVDGPTDFDAASRPARGAAAPGGSGGRAWDVGGAEAVPFDASARAADDGYGNGAGNLSGRGGGQHGGEEAGVGGGGGAYPSSVRRAGEVDKLFGCSQPVGASSRSFGLGGGGGGRGGTHAGGEDARLHTPAALPEEIARDDVHDEVGPGERELFPDNTGAYSAGPLGGSSPSGAGSDGGRREGGGVSRADHVARSASAPRMPAQAGVAGGHEAGGVFGAASPNEGDARGAGEGARPPSQAAAARRQSGDGRSVDAGVDDPFRASRGQPFAAQPGVGGGVARGPGAAGGSPRGGDGRVRDQSDQGRGAGTALAGGEAGDERGTRIRGERAAASRDGGESSRGGVGASSRLQQPQAHVANGRSASAARSNGDEVATGEPGGGHIAEPGDRNRGRVRGMPAPAGSVEGQPVEAASHAGRVGGDSPFASGMDESTLRRSPALRVAPASGETSGDRFAGLERGPRASRSADGRSLKAGDPRLGKSGRSGVGDSTPNTKRRQGGSKHGIVDDSGVDDLFGISPGQSSPSPNKHGSVGSSRPVDDSSPSALRSQPQAAAIGGPSFDESHDDWLASNTADTRPGKSGRSGVAHSFRSSPGQSSVGANGNDSVLGTSVDGSADDRFASKGGASRLGKSGRSGVADSAPNTKRRQGGSKYGTVGESDVDDLFSPPGRSSVAASPNQSRSKRGADSRPGKSGRSGVADSTPNAKKKQGGLNYGTVGDSDVDLFGSSPGQGRSQKRAGTTRSDSVHGSDDDWSAHSDATGPRSGTGGQSRASSVPHTTTQQGSRHGAGADGSSPGQSSLGASRSKSNMGGAGSSRRVGDSSPRGSRSQPRVGTNGGDSVLGASGDGSDAGDRFASKGGESRPGKSGCSGVADSTPNTKRRQGGSKHGIVDDSGVDDLFGTPGQSSVVTPSRVGQSRSNRGDVGSSQRVGDSSPGVSRSQRGAGTRVGDTGAASVHGSDVDDMSAGPGSANDLEAGNTRTGDTRRNGVANSTPSTKKKQGGATHNTVGACDADIFGSSPAQSSVGASPGAGRSKSKRDGSGVSRVSGSSPGAPRSQPRVGANSSASAPGASVDGSAADDRFASMDGEPRLGKSGRSGVADSTPNTKKKQGGSKHGTVGDSEAVDLFGSSPGQSSPSPNKRGGVGSSRRVDDSSPSASRSQPRVGANGGESVLGTSVDGSAADDRLASMDGESRLGKSGRSGVADSAPNTKKKQGRSKYGTVGESDVDLFGSSVPAASSRLGQSKTGGVGSSRPVGDSSPSAPRSQPQAAAIGGPSFDESDDDWLASNTADTRPGKSGRIGVAHSTPNTKKQGAKRDTVGDADADDVFRSSPGQSSVAASPNQSRSKQGDVGSSQRVGGSTVTGHSSEDVFSGDMTDVPQATSKTRVDASNDNAVEASAPGRSRREGRGLGSSPGAEAGGGPTRAAGTLGDDGRGTRGSDAVSDEPARVASQMPMLSATNMSSPWNNSVLETASSLTPAEEAAATAEESRQPASHGLPLCENTGASQGGVTTRIIESAVDEVLRGDDVWGTVETTGGAAAPQSRGGGGGGGGGGTRSGVLGSAVSSAPSLPVCAASAASAGDGGHGYAYSNIDEDDDEADNMEEDSREFSSTVDSTHVTFTLSAPQLDADRSVSGAQQKTQQGRPRSGSDHRPPMVGGSLAASRKIRQLREDGDNERDSRAIIDYIFASDDDEAEGGGDSGGGNSAESSRRQLRSEEALVDASHADPQTLSRANVSGSPVHARGATGEGAGEAFSSGDGYGGSVGAGAGVDISDSDGEHDSGRGQNGQRASGEATRSGGDGTSTWGAGSDDPFASGANGASPRRADGGEEGDGGDGSSCEWEFSEATTEVAHGEMAVERSESRRREEFIVHSRAPQEATWASDRDAYLSRTSAAAGSGSGTKGEGRAWNSEDGEEDEDDDKTGGYQLHNQHRSPLKALDPPSNAVCLHSGAYAQFGDIIARMWYSKQGTILDELANNLVGPDASAAEKATRLKHVAGRLRAAHGADYKGLCMVELLVLHLYTLAGPDTDSLMGYDDAPSYAPDGDEKAAWDAYSMRNKVAFREANWSMRAAMEHLEKYGNRDLREESWATVLKWVKFIVLLMAVSCQTAPGDVNDADSAGAETVYRGITGLPAGVVQKHLVLQRKQRFVWPAASSCAVEEKVSVEYVKGVGANAGASATGVPRSKLHESEVEATAVSDVCGPPPDSILFSINGLSCGVPLSKLSKYPAESEILLPPLAQMRVRSKGKYSEAYTEMPVRFVLSLGNEQLQTLCNDARDEARRISLLLDAVEDTRDMEALLCPLAATATGLRSGEASSSAAHTHPQSRTLHSGTLASAVNETQPGLAAGSAAGGRTEVSLFAPPEESSIAAETEDDAGTTLLGLGVFDRTEKGRHGGRQSRTDRTDRTDRGLLEDGWPSGGAGDTADDSPVPYLMPISAVRRGFQQLWCSEGEAGAEFRGNIVALSRGDVLTPSVHGDFNEFSSLLFKKLAVSDMVLYEPTEGSVAAPGSSSRQPPSDQSAASPRLDETVSGIYVYKGAVPEGSGRDATFGAASARSHQKSRLSSLSGGWNKAGRDKDGNRDASCVSSRSEAFAFTSVSKPPNQSYNMQSVSCGKDASVDKASSAGCSSCASPFSCRDEYELAVLVSERLGVIVSTFTVLQDSKNELFAPSCGKSFTGGSVLADSCVACCKTQPSALSASAFETSARGQYLYHSTMTEAEFDYGEHFGILDGGGGRIVFEAPVVAEASLLSWTVGKRNPLSAGAGAASPLRADVVSYANFHLAHTPKEALPEYGHEFSALYWVSLVTRDSPEAAEALRLLGTTAECSDGFVPLFQEVLLVLGEAAASDASLEYARTRCERWFGPQYQFAAPAFLHVTLSKLAQWCKDVTLPMIAFLAAPKYAEREALAFVTALTSFADAHFFLLVMGLLGRRRERNWRAWEWVAQVVRALAAVVRDGSATVTTPLVEGRLVQLLVAVSALVATPTLEGAHARHVAAAAPPSPSLGTYLAAFYATAAKHPVCGTLLTNEAQYAPVLAGFVRNALRQDAADCGGASGSSGSGSGSAATRLFTDEGAGSSSASGSSGSRLWSFKSMNCLKTLERLLLHRGEWGLCRLAPMVPYYEVVDFMRRVDARCTLHRVVCIRLLCYGYASYVSGPGCVPSGENGVYTPIGEIAQAVAAELSRHELGGEQAALAGADPQVVAEVGCGLGMLLTCSGAGGLSSPASFTGGLFDGALVRRFVGFALEGATAPLRMSALKAVVHLSRACPLLCERLGDVLDDMGLPLRGSFAHSCAVGDILSLTRQVAAWRDRRGARFASRRAEARVRQERLAAELRGARRCGRPPRHATPAVPTGASPEGLFGDGAAASVEESVCFWWHDSVATLGGDTKGGGRGGADLASMLASPAQGEDQVSRVVVVEPLNPLLPLATQVPPPSRSRRTAEAVTA